MPIYAYRCQECGFAKDVLQKVSDAQLTVCLSCGKPAFKKQLTAAGFQLKGSGWYVTDFRGGSSGGAAVAPSGSSEEASKSSDAAKSGNEAGTTPAVAPAAAPPAAASDS